MRLRSAAFSRGWGRVAGQREVRMVIEVYLPDLRRVIAPSFVEAFEGLQIRLFEPMTFNEYMRKCSGWGGFPEPPPGPAEERARIFFERAHRRRLCDLIVSDDASYAGPREAEKGGPWWRYPPWEGEEPPVEIRVRLAERGLRLRAPTFVDLALQLQALGMWAYCPSTVSWYLGSCSEALGLPELPAYPLEANARLVLGMLEERGLLAMELVRASEGGQPASG